MYYGCDRLYHFFFYLNAIRVSDILLNVLLSLTMCMIIRTISSEKHWISCGTVQQD
jgi:hypothetical protein